MKPSSIGLIKTWSDNLNWVYLSSFIFHQIIIFGAAYNPNQRKSIEKLTHALILVGTKIDTCIYLLTPISWSIQSTFRLFHFGKRTIIKFDGILGRGWHWFWCTAATLTMSLVQLETSIFNIKNFIFLLLTYFTH